MPIFTHLESGCILWFTFEYGLRFCVAPNRLQFVRELMNIVDLIAIVPFYLEISLNLCGVDITSLSDIKGSFLFIFFYSQVFNVSVNLSEFISQFIPI